MRYYGFNFQWMVNWSPGQAPQLPDEKALDFLVRFGFNFVRIPLDYRFWTQDFDYFHPDELVFGCLDQYLEACLSRSLHLCLNLHRAPGYCTNRNDLEKHNLWSDNIAQAAFVFLWETFARRYKGISPRSLSFNLINEPPCPGDHGLTRQNHAALIRRTVAAIRAVDRERAITIDGLGGGFLPLPELVDLNVTHSGRGYHPMPVTHHLAGWWSGHTRAPAPKYPGLWWQGRRWNRAALRASYKAWREVEGCGANIHIGEMGCFKFTPGEIALRWYADLLSVLRDFEWGYALWQFKGPFGIVEHGRPGSQFESIAGYNVDRALLELVLENRV